VLVGLVPGKAAVLICAAGMAAITVLVTMSPTMRRFPRMEPADDPGEPLAALETQSNRN